MIATITSKGQVTLPATIREQLRLKTGDRLDFFVLEDGHIEIVPLKESPRKLKGMVPKPAKPVTLEEMDEAIAKGGAD
jgi:AbrB family looped-hinge helix DNA binding protein